MWHTVLWGRGRRDLGSSSTPTTAITASHGAVVARLGPDGRIAMWREWQHLDDTSTWDERLRGPRGDDDTDLSAIDHVRLGMPAGGEDTARAFLRRRAPGSAR